MGHEYVGIVEEVGDEVTTHQAGPVRGRARSSPPTTPARSAGPATRPPASTGERIGRGAAPRPSTCGSRWPTAPWSPPRTSRPPTSSRSLLAASDVLGTGWFGAVAAEAGPGKTVAVVGDGAVGLLARAGRQAARRRADHRDEPARSPASSSRSSSAPPTSSTERGDEGVARIKDLTDGLGAHSVDRGGRHPGVDDAGDPLHPARRPRRLRRRRPRRGSCPARSCSSPTCTCTAAPPRYAGSCPT